MSARLLLLCPGQGGQHAAMNDLVQHDPAASALLAAAPLPAASLFENRIAQPAVVTATLAMWEALRTRLPMRPALVAGYSVGELSAHAVAGALAPREAIRLAHVRAAAMDAAASGEAQTLAAIVGVPVAHACVLARQAGFEMAIINGHDSCVVGGLAAQLEKLRELIGAAGARLQPLPVTVAAHTPYLAGSVAPFAQALRETAFAPPGCPLLAGVDAAPVSDAVGTLSRQLAETIRWSDCMDAAAEAGITVALELGPGAALSNMLQARHPQIACRSVAQFRSLDGIVGWLERQR